MDKALLLQSRPRLVVAVSSVGFSSIFILLAYSAYFADAFFERVGGYWLTETWLYWISEAVALTVGVTIGLYLAWPTSSVVSGRRATAFGFGILILGVSIPVTVILMRWLHGSGIVEWVGARFILGPIVFAFIVSAGFGIARGKIPIPESLLLAVWCVVTVLLAQYHLIGVAAGVGVLWGGVELAVAPEPAQRDSSVHPRPSRRPGEP